MRAHEFIILNEVGPLPPGYEEEYQMRSQRRSFLRGLANIGLAGSGLYGFAKFLDSGSSDNNNNNDASTTYTSEPSQNEPIRPYEPEDRWFIFLIDVPIEMKDELEQVHNMRSGMINIQQVDGNDTLVIGPLGQNELDRKRWHAAYPDAVFYNETTGKSYRK